MFFFAISVFLQAVFWTSGQSTDGCCEEIGCFPNEDPWVTISRQLPIPRCPPDLLVQFYLYTRNSNISHENCTLTTWPEIKMDSSDYDGNKTTMLFIHDYAASAEDDLSQELMTEYLKKVDANVILVDWNDDCENCTYQQAVSDARVVAAQIARLLKYLFRNTVTKPENIYLIGHGVGAHIAGLVGKQVFDISRITGLDPTGYLFESEIREVKLDTSDAQFVDVAHTNCHPITGIGTCFPLGHVDFFFNGGVTQPACPDVNYAPQVSKMIAGNYTAFYAPSQGVNYMCSHNLALKYYINALADNNCTYWGTRRSFWRLAVDIFTFGLFSPLLTPVYRCNVLSCSAFGLNTPKYPIRSSLDVATSDSKPYCIKNPGVDNRMAKELKEYIIDTYGGDSASTIENVPATDTITYGSTDMTSESFQTTSTENST